MLENPHKTKKVGSGPPAQLPLLENPQISHQKTQFLCPHKTFFFAPGTVPEEAPRNVFLM